MSSASLESLIMWHWRH